MATYSPRVDLSKFSVPVTGCGRVTIAASGDCASAENASAEDTSADVVDYEFLVSVSQEQCVFCHSSSAKLKVMRCFHLACVTCASDHLRYDNTLRCCRCQMYTLDPGPGRKLLESLVDWVPLAKGRQHTEASSERAEVEVQSGQDTDITELEECGTRSEATLQQDIIDSGSGSIRSDKNTDDVSSNGNPLCEDPVCKEHNEPAVSHCLDCEINMCDDHALVHSRLRVTRSHKQQPCNRSSSKEKTDYCLLHPLKKVKRYCSTCRVKLCLLCSLGQHSDHSTSDITSAVSAARSNLLLHDTKTDAGVVLDRVKKQIDQVNTDTEQVSQSITNDFDGYIRLLEIRKGKLLHELDEMRWRTLALLDTRRDEHTEIVRKREAAKHLLNHLESGDVLSLDTAVGSQRPWAERLASDPIQLITTYSHIIDTSTNITDINEMGHLQHVPDPKEKEVSADLAAITQTVYCHAFDPTEAASGIVLSKGNTHAEHIKRFSYRQSSFVSRIPTGDGTTIDPIHSVCGLGTHCTGCVTVKVKYKGGDVWLGYASSILPPTKEYIHKRGFLGWSNKGRKNRKTLGQDLRHPWEKNDIITLTLDVENLKMRATHSRPSANGYISIEAEIEVPELPVARYCFRAELGLHAYIELVK